MKYNFYAPEAFGFYGSPNIDESYVVAVALDENGVETQNGMLAYVCIDDDMMPPFVDLDSAENFILNDDMTEGLTPVIQNVDVDENGDITLQKTDKVFILTEEQNRMLVAPSYLKTESGGFWLDAKERVPMFRRDESLENITPVKLDMRKVNLALSDKYPALMEHTHIWYGHKYPEFPNAKYFEDRDKTVVFIAASQLPDISDSILDGDEPLFRDPQNGVNWDLHNTYGICIIDDSKPDYSIKLVSPYKLDLYCEQAKKEQLKARREAQHKEAQIR